MILWSHRGCFKNSNSENTIEALENAYKRGYRHIEFDIWFVNNELVVKHDEPTDEEIRKNKLVKLEDFINHYGNDMTYWMDFKNLTVDNIDAFLPIYKEIVEKSKIDYTKIWFAPYEMNWEVAAQLHSKMHEHMPDINRMFVIELEKLNHKKINNYYKILQESKVRYLSADYRIIDEKLVETFKNVTIFAWTVNDLSEVKRLKKDFGIRNICTDTIIYDNIK